MREKTETVKISEIGLDVLDVLLSDSGVCVLYWDCVQGWSIVGNGCEKLPKDGIKTLGLDAFIPLVQDKDAANAVAYFDMIRKSCSTGEDFETPSLNPLHAYMHIKSAGDVYISYHFCCRKKQRRAPSQGAPVPRRICRWRRKRNRSAAQEYTRQSPLPRADLSVRIIYSS